MASPERATKNAMSIMASGAVASAAPDALAAVSHDLKNPLTVLSAVTSLLAEGRSTKEDRARLLQIAQRATVRMERLIVDVLDNARIEARLPLPIEPRPTDLGALVREVCESLTAKVERERKTIDFDMREELPAVHADAGRLHRALANLVGNAVEFTPRGGRVRVLAERLAGQVRLSVSDSGRLFAPHWDATSTGRSGADMGLKIAKRIVEAHGSTLGATSTPGGGSTFFFTLPLALEAKADGNTFPETARLR